MSQFPAKLQKLNQKGIAHLGAIIILAGAIVAGLGYFGYSSFSKSGRLPDFIQNYNEQIRDRIKSGPKGCCIPFCAKDVTEIECERVYGGEEWRAVSCAEVDECRTGCCLPQCKDASKIECEGDYGYVDGKWQGATCESLEACELGCCTLEGGEKIEEQKAPCESVNGIWKAGECSEGEGYTVRFNDDTYISKTESETNIKIQLTDAYAQTCEGIYSHWSGSLKIRWLLTGPYGSQDKDLGEQKLGFTLKPGDRRLSPDESKITITHEIYCPYCEESTAELSGFITPGAECP